MKNQQVSVDVWKMFKMMLTYIVLTILAGIMIRLISAAFRLPGRMKRQNLMVQKAMKDLEERYPEAFKEAKELYEKNPHLSLSELTDLVTKDDDEDNKKPETETTEDATKEENTCDLSLENKKEL